MLWVSELLLQHHDVESFAELAHIVEERAHAGEMFLRMDVKPPFSDTPENWEEQLEAAFTGARPAEP
ncbi:MAG: sulfur relay protein DsrC [Gammaproteobacteria bacterium]|nr:sulfur relay protein DsrC [Gammaproteobacteria bacterium]